MHDASAAPRPEPARDTVLLVDDEGDLVSMLGHILADEFEVRTATGAAGALAALEREPVAVVVTDQRMPGVAGSALLAEVRRRWPLCGRVILSAFTDVRDLMTAINDGGVQAYLTKPIESDQLRLVARQFCERYRLAAQNDVLRRDLEEANRRLAQENRSLAERVEGRARIGRLVARSAAMRAALDRAGKVAPLDATVLITGETGAGKEEVARAIHLASPRRAGPFVAVHCGALTETLLASALFGHVRGAFTGAVRDQQGWFESAAGGTLLLDEVGETAPATQVQLLRALQEREVVRVGETRPRRVDVRVIAATHRDLGARVREGLFREDLYFRLAGFPIHVPPLRERREDIPELARELLDRIRERLGTATRDLDRAALDTLCAHPWPGNVRDLDNELGQAVVLAAGRPLLRLSDLSERARSAAAPAAAGGAAAGGAAAGGAAVNGASLAARVEAVERQALGEALRGEGGNLSRAATTLGLSRGGLKAKLRRFGLLPARG